MVPIAPLSELRYVGIHLDILESAVTWTLQPMHRNRHRGLQCQGIDLNTKCGAVSEDPSPSLYNYVITNTVTVESHKDGFRVVGWRT